MAAKRAAKARWIVSAAVAIERVTHGVRLWVGMTPTDTDLWTVMALETAAAGKGAQAVLDQHAHKLLGQWTFAEAVARAQAYSDAWIPGQTQDCACDEIPRRRRRR